MNNDLSPSSGRDCTVLYKEQYVSKLSDSIRQNVIYKIRCGTRRAPINLCFYVKLVVFPKQYSMRHNNF